MAMATLFKNKGGKVVLPGEFLRKNLVRAQQVALALHPDDPPLPELNGNPQIACVQLPVAAAAANAAAAAVVLHRRRAVHCRRCLRSLSQLPLRIRQQPVVHDHAYEPGCWSALERDRLRYPGEI